MTIASPIQAVIQNLDEGMEIVTNGAGEQEDVITSPTASIDLALGEPEVWSDPEKLKSLQDERTSIETELGPLSQEWERRASEMS